MSSAGRAVDDPPEADTCDKIFVRFLQLETEHGVITRNIDLPMIEPRLVLRVAERNSQHTP